ncbi:S-adenosyl-L-methionine-dependent methyltransferase [Truncatella angustata]|uniref:S-adenosyl-L-methionine-dependent methyltransferase n=1 Tax=Truncatella angustata TaxID=152316 RepID=A0A9P8U8S7_9PEZI|nr:S-adenosyl-L-methionine-dependent methyltransferase [Truncatella angustata]KAH6645514.1 S-adenosyl-L-methionine-dependent methyltransferase [Truncatella angustata]KAH8196462.1 hypothetical protein TruAng_009360 [Truncatella angustata]
MAYETSSFTWEEFNSGSGIEVADPDDIDVDEFARSEYDLETASTFGSITSSVLRHSFENGRRYHKFRHGTYPIPNDDAEQSRDEMKHVATLELTNGNLFFAPIGDNPQRIIDLGTGTGSWAIAMADKFPSAQVVGTDLSPIQTPWTPPNLRFVVDDIEDPWLHGDHFDLVHMRHTSTFIRDIDSVLDRCLAHLRPGGWIELQEFGGYAKCDDGSMGPDSPFARFMAMAGDALATYGFQWRVANCLDEILSRRGFVNINCKKFKAPLGKWPKNKKLRMVGGMYMIQTACDLMDAMAAKPLKTVMSEDEVAKLTTAAKAELGCGKSHIYVDYFFWYAQKPS